MKLVIPELEINESLGFAPEVDIFQRSGFGERLANLVENSGGNPVIALDSGWGEGKSTFIKMWRGYLKYHRETPITSIYFDAFENDYQKDAFLTLASEIYQLISSKDKEKQTAFRDKATKAVKSLTRGALKLTIKTATAGIVDGSALDSAEQELSNLIADQVDEIVKDRFQHAEKDKLALKEFKEHLSQFAAEINKGNPVVFIIDELDRCRPDFALNLLEQVKHLFSVKGLTFLLVTNRAQLEESIKEKYGQGIDPVNYLHKFINVWLSMPRVANEYNDHGRLFLTNALRSMLDEDDCIANEDILSALEEIIKLHQPSFRQIERILSYFSIIMNMTGTTQYQPNYQYMIAIVCYLKVCSPSALKLVSGKLNATEISKALKLNEVKENSQFYTLQYIEKLITFDLGTDEIRRKMLEENQISMGTFGQVQKNIILTISSWLSEINRS